MRQTFLYTLCCFAFLWSMASCSKGDTSTPSPTPPSSLPTVTTKAPTNITSSSAESGGTVTSEGGSPVTARGVCWSLVTPTVSNDKTVDGSGTGAFTSTLTGLVPITTYFVRAYATNSAGTAYGQTLSVFVPQATAIPTVSTTSVWAINSNKAETGGSIISNGNSPIQKQGMCWSTSPNPTTVNNKTEESLILTSFSTTISGLPVNTTYYARAYATNAVGTGYGAQVSFTTVYAIGELHAGGRVFYVDNSNIHGLVVALSDQTGGKWDGNSSWVSPNAFSYTNGSMNTSRIVSTIGTNNAAGVCRAYNGGGYNDWYLPSAGELNTLYQNRTAMGTYTNARYWSSTEESSYIGFAWSQDFGGGAQYNNSLKSNPYLVRAIRAF